MDKIIDIAIVIIFLICIWSGYKKGLVMGIGGIIAIIISLIGANIISNTFSYEVIPAMQPFASGYMEKRINEKVLPDMGFEDSPYSVADILSQNPDRVQEFCVECYESIGIYSNSAVRMADQAMEYAEDNDVGIQTAVVEVLCRGIAYVLGFILAFLLILIILIVIGNIPNLSFKLPNMNMLNDIGGAVSGVATAFCLCAVLVWALKFAGIIIGPETIKETFIAEAFAKMDMIGRVLGI